MDTEDGKNLTDAQEVQNLLNSRGWAVIKDKLDTRILDLQNINNLDMSDIATLSTQLAARKMAVDEMYAWLKGDVSGFVEQQAIGAARETVTETAYVERE